MSNQLEPQGGDGASPIHLIACMPGECANWRTRGTKRQPARMGGTGSQSYAAKRILSVAKNGCIIQLYFMDPSEVAAIRVASRRLVREFGLLNITLAGTMLHPSAVHAVIEIGSRDSMTASKLCDELLLDKSTVSRMVGKLVEGGEVAAEADDKDTRVNRLRLTEQGHATLHRIDHFANQQVVEALVALSPSSRSSVREGLSTYADALSARRNEQASIRSPVKVAEGYQPGLLGRTVEMHGQFYARTAGFGLVFEQKVAADMAEFMGRLHSPSNQFWSASMNGTIVGTVAIDGEHLGNGRAHLRWFIVGDGMRGAGVGRRLLAGAVAFCDAQGFSETHLWTFRGLDAARRLYEANGFELAEEQSGRQWGSEVIEQRFVRIAPSTNC